MRMRRLFTILLMMLTLATAGYGRGWEAVKAERSDVKLVVREADIEVKSATGLIQVSCNRPTTIKIFTILGRLVNSETLQGTMQFTPPAHGVYIVKAGTLTCKVAV